MKAVYAVFFLSFCLNFNLVQAQNLPCGATIDQEYYDQMAAKMGEIGECADNYDGFDITVPITINLNLRYAKSSDGTIDISETEKTSIVSDINAKYSPLNLSFNITWEKLEGDIYLVYENWGNIPPNEDTYGDCRIVGDIVDNDIDAPLLSGVCGRGGLGGFYLWKGCLSGNTMEHELGHALGLLHTHQYYTSSTPERVTRENYGECLCNCQVNGDLVCDTPADPNSGGCNFAEDLVDECLDNFVDEYEYEDGTVVTDISIHNIMSYYDDFCDGLPQYFTPGQNLLIRKTLLNEDGSYKFQHDSSEPPFSNELTIDIPTIKNSNEAFKGDIIVNSELTIENCVIELTEGHKILLHPGSKLTIRNATIRTYSGFICYKPMPEKSYWEGIEISPTYSETTELLVYENSQIDESEAGIYNVDGSTGLLNIQFNNSKIVGPAFDLENTLGVQKLFESEFDHSVFVKNNFHLGVEGCKFDIVEGGGSFGILATDTHLNVEKSNNGTRTSFSNCNFGIRTISSGAFACNVSNSDFIDVTNGLYAMSTAGFSSVHDCTFELIGGTGIYVQNFIDFEIYDNIISGNQSTDQRGIEIWYNLGVNDNPNLVINNTISDCHTGIYSFGAHLGNINSGVEYECNTLSNIETDNFKTKRIGPHQGRGAIGNFLGRPAGNKFDNPYCAGASDCYSDFNYNGGFNLFVTYHYRELGDEDIEYYNSNTNSSFLDRFTIDEINNNIPPNCVYPVPNGGGLSPMVHIKDKRIDSLDGGDTDISISLIKNDSDNDPLHVITEILDDSPWVSIPVVQTLFEYSEYYTEQEVAQVIIQNPGVLDDEYIYQVALKSGSFSLANQQLMIQAFQNGDDRITYEDSLVDDIREGTLQIKEVIKNELSNTTHNQVIIRNAVKDKLSYTKLYQTVESYLLDKDYHEALNALNTKAEFENFDPFLLSEKEVYEEIIQMESGYHVQGKDWSNITVSDYNRLNTIANTYSGFATIKARNILSVYHDASFGVEPTKPTYNPLTFLPYIPRSSREGATSASVYPNPANNTLNIELKENTNEYIFRLTNIEGKLVRTENMKGAKNTIDLSGIDKGIYIYEIILSDKSIVSDKIIILEN